MKSSVKYALLAVWLALPLVAQEGVLVFKDAPVPESSGTLTTLAPKPLTHDEEFSLLLALSDAQGAWITRYSKLESNQAGSDDLKRADLAATKYNNLLAQMKHKAGASDTPQFVWAWSFVEHKWLSQPVTQKATQGDTK